ncbi:MAPEG family protein [Luteithermobacter gelatinilyticus]|uniref:MAPEG family protein n=1 Tax=Luteithermobacter gelatinilyticus TaxID=2582913 RepID=UPI0011064650|nr:MAPEG family protein [Luteithermobacter gelatinilyticus]
MTLPLWMLLGFAVWTVLVLFLSVGIYRWSRILTGRVEIKEFRADQVEGQDFYLRSMRAHANCVENLPVFAVIVFALYVSGISTPLADILSVIVLVARVAQSVTHICFTQTNRVALVRFIFFLTQIVCFMALAVLIVQHGLRLA